MYSYNVQRNQGNNSVTANDVYTDIQGQIGNLNTASSFQTSTGIIAGTTYKIRIRANNKYGWTAYSSVVTMRAACPPNPPSTITITNTTIYMNFAWSLPVNNGADLTTYLIQFNKKNTGTWTTTTECDGTTAAVITNRACNVQMSTLVSTYSYAWSN